MPQSSHIMSIRELIDTAFGDPNINVVNHKLIQTVLVILARHLRLLERRVEVEIGPTQLKMLPRSSLSITEVKLHANVPRKKKEDKLPHAVAGVQPSIPGKKIAQSATTFATKSVPERSMPEKSLFVTASATKSTPEPSSAIKTFLDQTKDSFDKTQSSTLTKSSLDRTKSASDIKSPEKTLEEGLTSDKTSTEKISTEKSSSNKRSTEKSIGKIGNDKYASSTHKLLSSGEILPEPALKLQDLIEEQREQELRVIHQRADSREEHDKTPTPMASMELMEKQYEKLLIVERMPTDVIKSASRSHLETRSTQRLSIVTQDEFAELTTIVKQLQDKFSSVGTSRFPENSQLIDELRKGASLTDAMAALQLSARIEAAEKALEKMLTMVTELAIKTPGVDIKGIMPEVGEKYGHVDSSGKKSETKKVTTVQTDVSPKIIKSKSAVSKIVSGTQLDDTKQVAVQDSKKELKDYITYEELDEALQKLYDDFLKDVNNSITCSNTNANNALKIVHKLESKLDESLDLGDRMFDLEKNISEYADQINTLDTGLSSQMTYYQEQLTQMQHDLESGLETMAEALANTGGDTAAVAELNSRFTNLQSDIDTALSTQKELGNFQSALSFDLQSLWKQIETLKETKSDRDEVADALRDKAGLAALNGLVSRQEFDAVRGDFEKRIGSAYDKFNNQEVVWQKAIDDLLRELGEKADIIQVVSLQGSINNYLDKLRRRIQDMAEVVGEPRAAAISKRLHREANCLSCSTPAHMDLKESPGPCALPAYRSKRFAATGEDNLAKPGEDGDHKLCYPGMPITHAIDPRAHYCRRYCGGSHTVINNTLSRSPVGMIINPLKEVNTGMGTDGKLYMVDNENIKTPCVPCNFEETTVPDPTDGQPARLLEDQGCNMDHGPWTPPDYQLSMQGLTQASADIVSVTPPPPLDNED